MNPVIIILFIISVSYQFMEKYKYVLFDFTKKRIDNIDQHWPYCYTFNGYTISVLATSAMEQASVG